VTTVNYLTTVGIDESPVVLGPTRANYSQLAVPLTEIKQTIFGHREFTAFNEQVNVLLCKWKQANTPKLKAPDKDGRPKVLIENHCRGSDLLQLWKSSR
jgi:hypothetical protein